MSAVELAQVIEGWSAFAAAVGVIIAAVLAVRQLRAAAQASRLQAAIAVRQFVSSEEVVKARRFVVRELKDDYDPEKLTDEEIAQIERVTLSYQYAGHLLWLKLVSREDIIPDIGLAAILHWKKLKRWIDYIRKNRPNQRIHFEYLAAESEKFIRLHPDRFLTSIPTYDPTDDDLKSLQDFLSKQSAKRP